MGSCGGSPMEACQGMSDEENTMISLICRILKVKIIEIEENRMVVARAERWGVMGRCWSTHRRK